MIQWKTLRGRRTNPIGVIVPRRHGRKVLPRRRRSMSLLALSSLWWCLLLLVVYNCVGTVESATNPNNNKDKEHDYEGNDGVAFMIDDDDLEDSHFDFDNYEKKQCRDLRPACAEWAAPPGACHDGDNVLYMHAHCPVACGVCHERVTRFSTAATRRRSTRTTQPTKTNRGAATPDSSAPPLHQQQQQQQQPFGVYDQMLSERSVILYDAIRLSEPIRTTSSTAAWSRSVPQRLVGNDEIIDTAIRELLRDTADYLHTEVATDERYRLVRDSCRLHHSECALRAVTTNDCGNDDDDDVDDHVAAAEEVEQKKRRDFMIQNCAPVCFACEYQHIEAQCPIDPLAKHAWYPGDLNRMFERIVHEPRYQTQYNITALSRPDVAQSNVSSPDPQPNQPWVVMLDNFLSVDEANRLIALGSAIGYERSTDVGVVQTDGSFEKRVSTSRTSTNAWCNTDECESDPTVQSLHRRIEELTNIPSTHSEAFQLLQYEPGQFYARHHDYVDLELTRQEGVRILTVFLYLNTVTKGGETHFPRLSLTVQPQIGRALLWPSVLDDAPHDQDWQTEHQALPVEEEIKYGANLWLHQRRTDECDD